MLCIEIDLEKPTPSADRKTLVVAGTRGNAVTSAMAQALGSCLIDIEQQESI